MENEKILAVLTDMRNWIRASSFGSVRTLLEKALPDEKSRAAYQMLDGKATIDQVRVALKMSPNGVVALAKRCESMGLMEMKDDKKRVRLFDLADFGLIGEQE
jgi:DNA-binding transcriptional ArsR family regulator